MARWAAPPRSRSSFALHEIDENDGDSNNNSLASQIGRWLSTRKLDDDDGEDKVELIEIKTKNARGRSSRRRSSIKEDISRFFNRRRTSLPVVQLRPPKDDREPILKKAPPPVKKVAAPIEIRHDESFEDDDDSLPSSPPLAPFMLVDRSLLPPPPEKRRFSLTALIKK